MSDFLLKSSVLILFSFLVMLPLYGCNIFNKGDAKYSYSLEGDYEMIDVKSGRNLKDSATIEGFVYKKIDRLPIDRAVVNFSDSIGCFTDSLGYFKLKVPTGKRSFEVTGVAGVPQQTDTISFEEDWLYIFKFNLGYKIIR